MTELPLNLEEGDIVAIDDVEHVFARIDPDGLVTLRTLRKNVEFHLTDPQTGFPRKPNANDIARLMASGSFVKRAKDLEDGPRRAARKRELDARAARAVDPVCEFRTTFTREYDRAPCGRSDCGLRVFNEQLLANPTIAALPGARIYAGSTLRTWINKRGFSGDRRTRDGVAMSGYRRGRRVHHPKEILTHYLALSTGRKTTSRPGAKARALKGWQDYKGEMNRINRGQPTGRVGAVYPQPPVPYKAVSYTTFWRMCRDLESSATLEAQHGRQAVYQRYGGGGRTDRHTRIGAFAQMDDTPVPTVFLVDDDLDIPLGQLTLTLILDSVCKTLPGWGLSWDKASSATALEAYAHANTPKAIPKDIDDVHPELKWICMKPAAILLDNLTGHHSRHFEDSLLDVGTDVHFAGAHMPRDKAEMERVIGTILDLAFKDLPAATYDIARAREFGFDPTTMVMVPIRKARELLLRAICVYHLSPHAGLDGRSPALVFKQHVAKHGISVIDDLDEFRRSIGNVVYDAQLRSSGVVVKGLRYSDARITRALIDDLKSLQPPSEDTTKQTAITVKIKYSQADLGRIHVWNHRTKRYVTLPAVRSDYADGLPLWAHKRISDIAKIDMREFAGEDEESDGDRLIEIRKTLFEAIRNITPEAAEYDRATLAKLKETPLFKRIMGDIIEVVDEDVTCLVQPDPADAPDFQQPDGMGAEHRIDALKPTPRQKTGGGGTADGSDASAAAPPVKAPAKRRGPRKNATNRDSRDAGSPHKSVKSDTPAGTNPASKTAPKWGQTYD
jgi:putative transposase